MILRRGWAIGLLLAVVAFSLTGYANSAPTMEDQYVLTKQGQAVTFEIRAEDLDIDPLHPQDHPLTFQLLDGPMHGVLIGDWTIVQYREPHVAAVELTYAPAAGFTGTDFMTVTVVDPFDESAVGAVTVEVEVEAQRSLGILSGNWSTDVTYNTQTGGFTAFRTRFTEVYRVGNLTLKGIASIQMETNAGVKTMVFDALQFQGDFSVMGIDHNSTLAFDPNAAGSSRFDYWLASTRFTLASVGFSHTMYLLDTQTDSYQALSAWGNVGSLHIANTVRFDLNPDCGFVFARNDLSLSWVWCATTLQAAVGFTDAGFGQLVLTGSGIEVPSIGFLPSGLTLDASITFSTEEKTLSASLDWRPTVWGCMRLLAELNVSTVGGGAANGETSVQSVEIYGLRVECELPGEFGPVSFVSATSLDRSHNSVVTGQTDYFEMIRISGPLLSCCDYPGMWSIATYFNTDSVKLFDWGMTLLRADVVLSNHFNFTFESIIRSGFFGDPTLELSVGWMTRW